MTMNTADAMTACDVALNSSDNLKALEANAALVKMLTEEQSVLVANARIDGATWEQIATALGTTKQAAQQRFGRR